MIPQFYNTHSSCIFSMKKKLSTMEARMRSVNKPLFVKSIWMEKFDSYFHRSFRISIQNSWSNAQMHSCKLSFTQLLQEDQIVFGVFQHVVHLKCPAKDSTLKRWYQNYKTSHHWVAWQWHQNWTPTWNACSYGIAKLWIDTHTCINTFCKCDRLRYL